MQAVGPETCMRIYKDEPQKSTEHGVPETLAHSALCLGCLSPIIHLLSSFVFQGLDTTSPVTPKAEPGLLASAHINL